MGWVGRGGSYQISFQSDKGAVPAHHTAVHLQLLQRSDRNVQMREGQLNTPTAASCWLHLSQQESWSPRAMFAFSYCNCVQSAPSLDRLHPNACLYSWAALKSWGCRVFQSQCRQTTRHCHLQLGGSLWGQESSQADWPRPRGRRHMVGLWLWGRMPGTDRSS